MSNKNEQKDISVHIFGKEFLVKSDEDEAYTLKIARYLSDEMKIIAKYAGPEPYEKIAIIAALNITDKYFKEKEKNRFIEEKISYLIQGTKEK